MTFYDLLWYFTIYSFLGWCSEVIFATVSYTHLTLPTTPYV